MGQDGTIDFRYHHDDQSGSVASNDAGNWDWIRAIRRMIRLDSGRQLILLTHHKIPQPSAGELLGRTLLSSFPGFIFVKDEKYRFRYLNETLLKTVDSTNTELLNKTDDVIS